MTESSGIHSLREPTEIFQLTPREPADPTLRLREGRGAMPPMATAICLAPRGAARLVARLEHRLDLVESSGNLPTGSHQAWRAELAVVACLDGASDEETVLCESVCDAVTHRLWSNRELGDGTDEAPIAALHAHVAEELERVRARKKLGAEQPSWAAALARGATLWLLGDGEASVYLRLSNGAVRITELRERALRARIDLDEVHGVAVALGEAKGTLDASLVGTCLAREVPLDACASDLAERACAAGAVRGGWIVARFDGK
ncbi:MAG: hypothetical protein H6724_01740 [Sandaracinus sp.]|nr:hypothetical protein [Sandaracinus sp.]MCB9625315.1 hypothetical protein [Sandaracinus sp.]